MTDYWAVCDLAQKSVYRYIPVMDASNEFKVFLSPSSSSSKKSEGEGSSGVRQRLVPVINKVFSPSHFMLAQRKTTVYKAVSGVSFQDIDIGGKKKSSSARREKDRKHDKKDQIYTTSSDGERSLQSTKSERSVLSSNRVKAFLSSKDESRVEARKHRYSLGSRSERPSNFLNDNAEKTGLTSSDKKTRTKSTSRSRSVSATENLYLSRADEDNPEAPPPKPQRSRSSSRPRSSVSKVSMSPCATTSTGSTTNSGGGYSSRKRDEQKSETEGNSSNKDEGGSVNSVVKEKSDKSGRRNEDKETESKDSCDRSRVRKKSDNGRKSEESSGKRKLELEKKTRDDINKDDEDPEGGYFSLEKEEKAGGDIKFIYEALPTNSCEEYLENDQCVEAIYVCQVFKKDSDSEEDKDEHIYENFQVIKMTRDGQVIPNDDQSYANYQIIRRVKETELLDGPEKLTNSDIQDENLYETVNFVGQNPLMLTQTTATQTRLRRHRRPLGSIDSIPFIDDSDNSGDELERRNPVSKGLSPRNSVTVITIKDDDDMEVTQKVSPLRTKPVLLRSQEGSEESPSQNSKTDFSSEAESGELTAVSEVQDTEKTKSSDISKPQRPARYSYPATSPSFPKLCDKIGHRLARHSPVNVKNEVDQKVDVRVKKSMSHSDVQMQIKNGTKGPVLSESFSDDDIRNNEEFESFSETDSDLDNLDYDMFTPRVGKSGRGRSPLKGRKRVPRGRSLSASHASPVMTSTPCRANPHGESSTSTGKLQSLKTFQDLLGDKCLNPPETDVDSQAGECAKCEEKLPPLRIHESSDIVLRGPRDMILSSHRNRGAKTQVGDQEILDDTLSFTWSDAESEFEFIDCNKVEPPKTCIVYQGVTVTSSVMAAGSTTATTTTTTVKAEKKLSSSIKRAQSMKGMLSHILTYFSGCHVSLRCNLKVVLLLISN